MLKEYENNQKKGNTYIREIWVVEVFHKWSQSTQTLGYTKLLDINSVSCFIACHIFVDIFITIDRTVTKFSTQTEKEKIDIL